MTSTKDFAGHPALALFGTTVVDLKFAAPTSEDADDCNPANLNMSGFPPQPDRFVGRTRVMAEASEALAAQSGVPGVLLHGMPGGGKTACALELAYTHEHAFDSLVWYKTPDEGTAIEGALTEFSLTLEQHLPGFQMAHLVYDTDKLTPFLAKLTELMERKRLLLIIDNAESLLTEDANWRDDRWGLVIAALTAHTGLGRLILTSRRVPNGETALRVESVDALSPDEALLLARELPHLNALMHGEIPGINRLDGTRLARRTLEVAQGHPKLLELAEGQAASPEQLAQLVEAGGQAWRKTGGLPGGFFAGGETTVTGEDYLDVLAAWTKAVADAMAPDERIVFQFLCSLEVPDRERHIIDGIWAKLWEQVDKQPPPSLDQALTLITTYGLAAARPGTSEFYAVHPGVAAAGRNQADESLRQMIDAVAATYWDAIYLNASGAGNGSTEHSALQAHAGLAAIPYLMRLELWRKALTMLEGAFIRSPSRATAIAVLPPIRHIIDHEARATILLAAVLEAIDLAAAETSMRISLDAAIANSDYRMASAASARLVNLYRDRGRLTEALDLIDEMIGYTKHADLGPWTQVSNQVQRLQVLNAMGYRGQVLDEVQLLRTHLRTLPSPPDQDEIAIPWNVHETLLATGRSAAIDLGHWDGALDLNAAQITSMRDRNAPVSEIARARFSDYLPLLRVGRTGAVLDLLIDCRQVFLEAHDPEMLGMVTAAIADVEDARGHSDIAIQLEQDALRHSYLAGNVVAIAGIYHNLGIYLRNHADQPSLAFGCHLAAALIHSLTGAGHTDKSMHQVGIDMRVFGARAVPPRELADLCRRVHDIPGTDLPGLIAKLSPDQEVAEEALHDIVTKAQELATAPTSDEL